jgi:hypothetical protein
MKLNLGSGKNHKDGFLSIDITDVVGADIVHDLTKYPWPFNDNSIDEILASHFIEHLDGIERMAFFNECYRIMKVGATMKCITPGAFTSRYMQDPTHKFPMVVAEFYNYLNENVRITGGLDHYPLTCNFDLVGHHELNNIYHDMNFAQNHLVNSVNDLVVMLTKI